MGRPGGTWLRASWMLLPNIRQEASSLLTKRTARGTSPTAGPLVFGALGAAIAASMTTGLSPDREALTAQ